MGLEYISQPQVFLSPITAVGGIQNGLLNSPVPPFFTSFYTWTSSTSVTATTFPLTGIEILTNNSGSFIVTVGGVLQSPETYIIDNIGRTITFNTPVNEDTIVLITQIGTIATSALNISLLTANNSYFDNIIGVNSNFTNITAANSNLIDVIVTNLQVLSSQFFGTTVFDTVTATNLIVLSSVTQVQETVITPTSAISLTAIGDALFLGPISAIDLVTIDGDLTVGGTIYTINGNSDAWNNNTTVLQSNTAVWDSVYFTVSSLSGNWEESADILPTVTNYLSTELVIISSLNVTEQLLSAGTDLLNIFQAQTLTYTESSYDLEISNGNIVNLSSINTTFADNSGKYEDIYTIVQTNSSAVWEYQGTDLKDLSAGWQSTYETVSALSASWEESADILPTVTNYLSTELVTVSSLNVTQQLLSGNTDLLSVFLTPSNTLTTSISAMSGDGVTPFVMQFTNGLLTSLTV